MAARSDGRRRWQFVRRNLQRPYAALDIPQAQKPEINFVEVEEIADLCVEST